MVAKSQGRPIGSSVRQNMVEILYAYGPLYGYQIHKIYEDIFPKITLRLVYYHLKKGLSTKEFSVYKMDIKEGNYSWGARTQNIIYTLGPEAKAVGDARVREYKEKEKNNIKEKS